MTIHRTTLRVDRRAFSSRNFRTDDGVFQWAKVQAERKSDGLDVPKVFLAVFEDRTYSALRVLGGEQ